MTFCFTFKNVTWKWSNTCTPKPMQQPPKPNICPLLPPTSIIKLIFYICRHKDQSVIERREILKIWCILQMVTISCACSEEHSTINHHLSHWLCILFFVANSKRWWWYTKNTRIIFQNNDPIPHNTTKDSSTTKNKW